MKKTLKSQIGEVGERIAAKYLESKKYKILQTNYLAPGFGEIDIIALDKNELVFVEVKTRSQKAYGEPVESISYFKIRALHKSINFFLKENLISIEKHPMRIDVIGISIKNSKKAKLKHFKAIM